MVFDFRNIQLGKADAQEEGAEYPDLLLNGYYDNNNIVNQVYDTTKFLFLGYKGSGKSALSEHLKLSASEGVNVVQQSLKDFPYKTFAKIVSGDSEQEYKSKVAWRWLLLVQVLSNLIADKDAKPTNVFEIEQLTDFMTQSGVFPLVGISALVTKTTSRKFQTQIKNFSYAKTTTCENAQISFEWLIDYIKHVISGYKEMHSHVIVIDGLDDILTSREIQYLSIAALINEVKDLNLFFKRNELPFKIIVLCRTDIFERLPDANKNKIKRDCSYTFCWYKEGQDKQNDCGLIDILNLRGRLVYPEIGDVIQTLFPTQYKGTNIYEALLEMTRHTPRDFMQLMLSIQTVCTSPNVTNYNIEEGIKEYSTEYFLPEIKDEMAGYIQYKYIDSIVNILSSFREREFSYKQFLDSFNRLKIETLSPDSILNVLYDCSAIGHAYPYGNGCQTRITFKYRNRNSSFNKSNRIILHKGLWKALNVNY